LVGSSAVRSAVNSVVMLEQKTVVLRAAKWVGAMVELTVASKAAHWAVATAVSSVAT